jgi:hypothetical protein
MSGGEQAVAVADEDPLPCRAGGVEEGTGEDAGGTVAVHVAGPDDHGADAADAGSQHPFFQGDARAPEPPDLSRGSGGGG